MKKFALFIAVAAVSLSYGATISLATPAKARATGLACSQCHQAQATDQNPGQRGTRVQK